MLLYHVQHTINLHLITLAYTIVNTMQVYLKLGFELNGHADVKGNGILLQFVIRECSFTENCTSTVVVSVGPFVLL